jgi:hypothetical protein
MTDRTQPYDSPENSGGATRSARTHRPATAPAHYLGVPAEVWMAVFRRPRPDGKNAPARADDRRA